MTDTISDAQLAAWLALVGLSYEAAAIDYFEDVCAALQKARAHAADLELENESLATKLHQAKERIEDILTKDRRKTEEINLLTKEWRGMEERLRAAEAANARLRDAATALIEKMDYVHKHPAYIGVWVINQIHDGLYPGPQYQDEIEAVKLALGLAPQPAPDKDISTAVMELAEKYKEKWTDESNDFWYRSLTEEFLELSMAMDGQHEHPPEYELTQIGAIAINFIRHLRREQPAPAPDRLTLAAKKSADAYDAWVIGIEHSTQEELGRLTVAKEGAAQELLEAALEVYAPQHALANAISAKEARAKQAPLEKALAETSFTGSTAPERQLPGGEWVEQWDDDGA